MNDGRDESVDDQPHDGRVARRQRNIDAVLDVVIDMLSEDAMFPTMEQVASRSGLSLRSLYRYFADPGELIDAAITRTSRIADELTHLRTIGEGPLGDRIDDFVSMRVRLHAALGHVARASVVNAAKHPKVRERQAINRNRMREQFDVQFAPELSMLKPPEREAVTAAGDLLTHLDSIDLLRRHRQLSVAETHDVLCRSLLRLLG